MPLLCYNLSMTNNNCEKHEHPNYENEIPKLNRVVGQLEGVKKMINEHRYCPEILIQLTAARSAIKSVEKNILSTHLEKCVAESFLNNDNAQEKIKEIGQLINKLSD